MLAPFEILKNKKLAENAHLPVLYTDKSSDDFRRLSIARELPAGAKLVACLAIIFGPEPKKHTAE